MYKSKPANIKLKNIKPMERKAPSHVNKRIKHKIVGTVLHQGQDPSAPITFPDNQEGEV